MKKLVIFDLDGTLLDTLEDLTTATNHALALHGLPRRSTDEVRAFVGNGIPRLAALAVPTDTDSATEAAVLKDLLYYYQSHCREQTRPYPGVSDLLGELKKQGIKTAVVSNKADAAVRVLCEEYFPGLCDFCAGEKADVRKKPAPDTVFAVLTQLKINKTDAVYVGDSEVDIATAKNAGLPCLSVTWGFRDEKTLLAAGAETLVHNVYTLKRLLLPAETTE